MIAEKTKLKATDSTSNGCECHYFTQNDGTGWKVYRDKSIALLAWGTQKWAYEKGFAPKILSNIVPIMIQYKPRSFYCPLKVSLFFQEDYKIYINGRCVIAPCNEKLKGNQDNFTISYGFITEEVDEIAMDADIDNYLEDNLFDEMEDYFEDGYRGDFHNENWGLLNGEAKFIDFGSHFTKHILIKHKKEINAYFDEADNNIYNEKEIKSFLGKNHFI